MSKKRSVLVGVVLCAALSGGPAQAQDWPAVFDPLQLMTLNLQMEPADWDTIRHDLTYDIEVQTLLWADGEAPILVSARRKSCFALPSEDDPQKVSLKLDINEYVKGQKWHGLYKLSLENGDDVDVVAEGLAWHLHRWASGPEGYGYAYPAALANWVRVYVNGQYIGLYLNVEQRDKQYLKNRGLYVKKETWLYKFANIGAFEMKVGDDDNVNSPTQEALCFLPFACNDILSPHYPPGGPCPAPDPASLEVILNANIDMKAMLTMPAVNAFVSNPDSLFSHGGNTFCADFLDGTPRMYFPWDLDGVLKSASSNIYSRMKGKKLTPTMYQEMILAHPTFRPQFNQIMTDLLDGPFAEADILAFLDAVEQLIGPSLEEDPNNNLDGETVAVSFDSIRQWISERIPNVREQIFEDQPPVCGNGTCEWGEDACTCELDCGLPAASEVPNLTCADNADNDCDGLTDCQDPDCAADPACQTLGCDFDGICDPGEDCSTCPDDCGGKAVGAPSKQFCCGDGIAQPAEGDGSICDGNY